MNSRASKFEKNYIKVLEFISPFLRDQIAKQNGAIYSSVKGMAYAQALICIEIIVNTLEQPSLVNVIFIFLFPILIGIGIFTGICESQNISSGHALSVLLTFFMAGTVFHILGLTILFYMQGVEFAVAFVVSIIAIFNLVGIGLHLNHRIKHHESS